MKILIDTLTCCYISYYISYILYFIICEFLEVSSQIFKLLRRMSMSQVKWE